MNKFLSHIGVTLFFCMSSQASVIPVNIGVTKTNTGIEGAELVDDSDGVILALKFVEFAQASKSPAMTKSQIKTLVSEMNAIFSTCRIQFQDEEYSLVEPEKFGLPYHLNSVANMHEIRKPFDDPRYIVVINTGSWDHHKMGAPNAWTAMPGETPSGAVLEAPVSNFAGIVAHEIGHYLNLNHVNSRTNLMNPIIYGNSNKLNIEQCANMRDTALKVRKLAIRQYDGGKPTVSLSAAYSG